MQIKINHLNLMLQMATGLLLYKSTNADPIQNNNNTLIKDSFSNHLPSPAFQILMETNSTHIIEQAAKNAGNEHIEPMILQEKLFDANDNLNTTELWNAWHKFKPNDVYDAIKLSTNGKAGKDRILVPVDLMAASVMNYIMLQDAFGPLPFKKGKIPDFRFQLSGAEHEGQLNGRQEQFSQFNPMTWPTQQNVPSQSYTICYLPENYDLAQTSKVKIHEDDHALTDGKVRRDLQPYKSHSGSSIKEPWTEFMASLLTQDTTDNPEREKFSASSSFYERGQYIFTAFVKALSDPDRNTGNLNDLQLLPTDYPEVSADGSSPPIRLNDPRYKKGIKILADAYYRGEDSAMLKVDHLLKQVTSKSFFLTDGFLRTFNLIPVVLVAAVIVLKVQALIQDNKQDHKQDNSFLPLVEPTQRSFIHNVTESISTVASHATQKYAPQKNKVTAYFIRDADAFFKQYDTSLLKNFEDHIRGVLGGGKEISFNYIKPGDTITGVPYDEIKRHNKDLQEANGIFTYVSEENPSKYKVDVVTAQLILKNLNQVRLAIMDKRHGEDRSIPTTSSAPILKTMVDAEQSTKPPARTRSPR